MSVSALTNSFYVYTPVTVSQQSQNNVSSSNSSVSSNQPAYEGSKEKTAENVNQTSQNSQAAVQTSQQAAQQTENSSNQNSSSESYYGLTGEEILASRPESENKSADTKQLTEEEQKQVEELKARDREVKTHEQAHIAAGGSYVRGGASYDYQTGPDGKKYAVGGNVSIDTSAVEGDPQATINKAQIIIKAALAPAEPSSQDKAVANQARQMMSNARKELMQENKSNNSVDDKSAQTDKTNKSDKSSSADNSTNKAENSSTSSDTANNNSSKKSTGTDYSKSAEFTTTSFSLTA